MAPYSVLKMKNVANVKTDRIFKLSYKEELFGKRTLLTAKFKNTELHAIQDNGLWYLAFKTPEGYGSGELPETLKQRWTNFNQLRKFLDTYFEARSFKIEEIIA